MAKIKIQLKNGKIDSYKFETVVKENLEKEGFNFINMGYSPMSNRITYHIRKNDEFLGEISLPRKLTQQEVLTILKEIKRIKDLYTPPMEEIEFDL